MSTSYKIKMNSVNVKNKYSIEWILILITFVVFVFLPILGHELVLFATLGVLTLFFYVMRKEFIIRVKMSVLHLYLLLFSVFTYISSIWALNREYTFGRGNTMLITFSIITIMFMCFSENMKVDPLLRVIMMSGYIVAVVSVIYYGPRNIIGFISEGERLTITDEFLNINELGMCATYAIIINIYYWVKGEKKMYSILSIPAFLIMLSSGSRKAIAILVIGLVSLYVMRNNRIRNTRKRLVKMTVSLLLILALLYLASRMSLFSGIMGRIQLTINGILTGKNTDYSTLTRLNLVAIGWQIFREHPVLGIGIGNAQFVVEGIYHRQDYYLHNNYIEMLANGGIIGFILYYWFFIYLIITFIKNRDFSDMEFNICFILLFIHLIMDIGSVSYVNRTTYFYIMMFYIKAVDLKYKKNRK